MIALLNGEIIDKQLDQVVLEVNGIGYQVYVSLSELEQLTLNEKYRLFIFENIREDAYDLYGFLSLQTKKLFELLISVKNVGPKVGLAILGIGSEDKIRNAIAGGDIRVLMSAKGVGKRAAEQLIVELKDKVGLMVSSQAEDIILNGSINSNDEALQALMSLGYSQQDALTSLSKIDPKLTTEERVKQALRGINS